MDITKLQRAVVDALEDVKAQSRGGGAGAASSRAGAGGCPYYAARALFAPPAGEESRRAQLVGDAAEQRGAQRVLDSCVRAGG